MLIISYKYNYTSRMTIISGANYNYSLIITLNTLTGKLSQTCYSRDTPARGARGPYKVCDNLHSIARIKAEMPF